MISVPVYHMRSGSPAGTGSGRVQPNDGSCHCRFPLWRESWRECNKKGTGRTWFYLRSGYQLEMAPWWWVGAHVHSPLIILRPHPTCSCCARMCIVLVLGELFPCSHASSLPLRSKPCAEQSMANTKWTQQWFCRLLVSYCFIWVFLFGCFGFVLLAFCLNIDYGFQFCVFMFLCVTCFYFIFKISIYFLFVF